MLGDVIMEKLHAACQQGYRRTTFCSLAYNTIIISGFLNAEDYTDNVYPVPSNALTSSSSSEQGLVYRVPAAIQSLILANERYKLTNICSNISAGDTTGVKTALGPQSAMISDAISTLYEPTATQYGTHKLCRDQTLQRHPAASSAPTAGPGQQIVSKTFRGRPHIT